MNFQRELRIKDSPGAKFREHEAVMDAAEICSCLAGKTHSVKFSGFTALDEYLRLPPLPFCWIETDADITVLARLFGNLRFPGLEMADGAVDTAAGPAAVTCYFRCLDTNEKMQPIFPLLAFTYDWRTKRFQDPLGLYPLLRKIRDKKEFPQGETGTWPFYRITQTDRFSTIMDGALLLARYGDCAEIAGMVKNTIQQTPAQGDERPPGPEKQRVFLSCLLVSPSPERGLELLKHAGFLDELWPELACYSDVDHSKEYHPEGNVWDHTLETFRYRKAASSGAFDLRLSLALLLHDSGKPISASSGNHRFDGHAELGARAAVRFLERLGFSPSLIQDVFYLVKNHMLPAALKRLPHVKTAEIMASPLFPTLMELYRCDESSSFKGLDGYYENSAAYQAYLKNLKNPYRCADGKKIGKKRLYSIITSDNKFCLFKT